LEFLGFAAINALIGLVSNANPIGLVAVPLIAGSWWLYDRRRKRQSLRLRGVSLMKKLPQPAKSLILLVSTYSPRTQQVSADQAAAGIQQILAKGELQRERLIFSVLIKRRSCRRSSITIRRGVCGRFGCSVVRIRS
jgi:hypothetical protein